MPPGQAHQSPHHSYHVMSTCYVPGTTLCPQPCHSVPPSAQPYVVGILFMHFAEEETEAQVVP